MITIEESGMTFTFPEGDCFHIEKDEALKPHVKPCEFIARISHRSTDLLYFVEAKSSAPKECICDRSKLTYDGMPIEPSWTVHTNFDNFVNDICRKFEDSFALFHAICSGYHGNEAKKRIPAGFVAYNNTSFRFILIINGFKDEWFPPLNDALKQRMRHFLNAWNISDICMKTLNAEGASALGIPVV